MKADTPGFPSITLPEIKTDINGVSRIHLPRHTHNRRLNTLQTPMYLAHGWRANCDMQILLYKSDPLCPDPADIAQVTDYIVSYAFKGDETQ